MSKIGCYPVWILVIGLQFGSECERPLCVTSDDFGSESWSLTVGLIKGFRSLKDLWKGLYLVFLTDLGRRPLPTGVNVIENHPAWSKLEDLECGDSAADRIIGGVNAALGQYPWIARLGYKIPEEADLDWMCGAALVTDRHVITAAHCIMTAEDEYILEYIRLGEHDDRQDPDCVLNVCAPKVQDRKAKKVTVHPQYNKPAFHNDIAIIELDRPLSLNDYVAPICLPRTEEQMTRVKLGEAVTVAGWGKMNMTTQQRANVLQTIKLPVVAQTACSTFGVTFKMADSEICAGAQHNRDACGGDSGGPLMKVFDTMDGPKSFLVGVVSFGPTVCGTAKPGVYTSVPYFMSWILNSIM